MTLCVGDRMVLAFFLYADNIAAPFAFVREYSLIKYSLEVNEKNI